MFPGGLRPRLKQSESEGVPVFEQPKMGLYKKEDIPLFEEAAIKNVNEYQDADEDPFRGYGNNYLDHMEEEEDEEMQGYGSNLVQEEVEYDEYREREEARAEALHNYYQQLQGSVRLSLMLVLSGCYCGLFRQLLLPWPSWRGVLRANRSGFWASVREVC